MKRGWASCFAAALLLSGVGGCRAEKEPRAVEYEIGPGDTYVALGDSYTAATKTGPAEDADGCGRSLTNYPHRIATTTGAELVDNSCNGASSRELAQKQDNRFFGDKPPQLDAIDDDTDLVTMRIGANDYLLIGRIIRCGRLGKADAPGTPCTDDDAAEGDNRLEARLRDVRDNLDAALGEVQRRGPNARIMVVGYPRLLPDSGTCADAPLPAGDYPYARAIIEGLNEALQAAADAVDATYIDMYAASKGHDVCSDDPWVAGAPADGTEPTGANLWHPYAAEGQAVAELVLAALKP